jgi:hypothetical protein
MPIPPDVNFMHSLESEFVSQCLGGDRNPARYKIWYSGIDHSPVILLGINPAGSEDNYLTASKPYEEWGYDFSEYELDTHYRLAKGAMRFLRHLVGEQTANTNEIIRRIPVGNVCFFRNQDPRDLAPADYEICSPYVLRILRRVDPIVIVTTGDQAYIRTHDILGTNFQIIENSSRTVTTPNGSSLAKLYRSYNVADSAHRLRKIIRLAHLSTYGLGRDRDWSAAYVNLECDLAEVGLRPFTMN